MDLIEDKANEDEQFNAVYNQMMKSVSRLKFGEKKVS